MQEGLDTTAAADNSSELWAMAPCDTTVIPGGVVLTSRRDESRVVVMQEVAVALQQCNEFRTLSEHAGYLVQRFPQLQGNRDDAMRVLNLVREAGLMVSANALCSRVNDDDASESAPHHDRTVTCVLTCDRPEALGRLLDSMLRNTRLSRQKRILLIDDSRDPANVSRNAELVADFSRVSPVNMEHIDPPRQAALVAELKSLLPQQAGAIDWLFSRESWPGVPTYGRARNFALLCSVGERCLMLDDDILCKAYPALHASTTLPFNAPREAHCFAGQSDWLSRLTPLDADALVEQGRCLGLTLGGALRALGQDGMQPAHCHGVQEQFLAKLTGQSRILVTQCGTLGDPGTVNNLWLAQLPEESLRRIGEIFGPYTDLAQLFASREFWLGHGAPTLLRRANMSQMTGVDNRALLPPYLPVLRGEDRLFGTMVACLHPTSAVLDYDWAVPHLPVPPRSGNPDGDIDVPRGGLSMVDNLLAQLMPEDTGVTTAVRLSIIADGLQGFAELSDSALQSHYARWLSQSQGSQLASLATRLNQPVIDNEQWSQWLRRNLEHTSKALQEPPRLTDLPDVPRGMPQGDLLGHLRNGFAGMGAALRAWPAIREAAGQLGADG